MNKRLLALFATMLAVSSAQAMLPGDRGEAGATLGATAARRISRGHHTLTPHDDAAEHVDAGAGDRGDAEHVLVAAPGRLASLRSYFSGSTAAAEEAMPVLEGEHESPAELRKKPEHRTTVKSMLGAWHHHTQEQAAMRHAKRTKHAKMAAAEGLADKHARRAVVSYKAAHKAAQHGAHDEAYNTEDDDSVFAFTDRASTCKMPSRPMATGAGAALTERQKAALAHSEALKRAQMGRSVATPSRTVSAGPGTALTERQRAALAHSEALKRAQALTEEYDEEEEGEAEA